MPSAGRRHVDLRPKSGSSPFGHPLSIPNRLRDADAQGNPNDLSDNPSTEPSQLNLNSSLPKTPAPAGRRSGGWRMNWKLEREVTSHLRPVVGKIPLRSAASIAGRRKSDDRQQYERVRRNKAGIEQPGDGTGQSPLSIDESGGMQCRVRATMARNRSTEQEASMPVPIALCRLNMIL